MAYVWPLPLMLGLLANAVDPWDWTLWETPRLLVHVQVTVAPTATVSTAGLAVPLWALLNTIPPLFPTVTDPTGPLPPPPPPPPTPAPTVTPARTPTPAPVRAGRRVAGATRERRERDDADDCRA